jgi:PBP1b-binding outer membrane lipoprotein LpoB
MVQKCLLFTSSVLLVCFAVAGCASTGGLPSRGVKLVEPGSVTEVRSLGVETQDILACADNLARDLLGIPAIAGATPFCRIAMRQIVNSSNSRVDTAIITNEIRQRLLESCNGRVRFVERSRGGEAAEFDTDVLAEREMKREGIVDSGKQKSLAGVDFFLKGELRSHSVATDRGMDVATFYYVDLVDTESAELVWSGKYGPIRKVVGRGVAYP